MAEPLRSVGVSRTTDAQRKRRANKRFDAFGRRRLTNTELEERIIALEAQIADNAEQITTIMAALKAAGMTQ